jgi:hypothetical protein
VSDAEPEDMLIIQGNFLDSPYYFWVCMHTKIAALGDLWLRVEYGEDTNTTLDGIQGCGLDGCLEVSA